MLKGPIEPNKFAIYKSNYRHILIFRRNMQSFFQLPVLIAYLKVYSISFCVAFVAFTSAQIERKLVNFSCLIGYIFNFSVLIYSLQQRDIAYSEAVDSFERVISFHNVRGLRQLFYLQKKFYNLPFSVCGLFCLNWKFLIKVKQYNFIYLLIAVVLHMVGSILANVFILMQFDNLYTK